MLLFLVSRLTGSARVRLGESPSEIQFIKAEDSLIKKQGPEIKERENASI